MLVNIKHLNPVSKNTQKNEEKFRWKTGHVCLRAFLTEMQIIK